MTNDPVAPDPGSETALSSVLLLANQAAQFCAQTFDLGKFLFDAFEQRPLYPDSFVDQKCGRFGASAEYTGLDQLAELLLRVLRNFHGQHVTVFGRDSAFYGSADVAPDCRKLFGNTRRHIGPPRSRSGTLLRLFGFALTHDYLIVLFRSCWSRLNRCAHRIDSLVSG